ncbi:MAG: ubiquitin family protein [archaeon]|nr:ubiquitin family protein [archaeon]
MESNPNQSSNQGSQIRKIKIKTMDNKLTEVEVKEDTPVEEFKKMLETIFHKSPESQRLIFKGKQMKAGQKVGDFIKKDDEIIHLLFKTPEQTASAQNREATQNNEGTQNNQNQSQNQNQNNPFISTNNIFFGLDPQMGGGAIDITSLLNQGLGAIGNLFSGNNQNMGNVNLGFNLGGLNMNNNMNNNQSGINNTSNIPLNNSGNQPNQSNTQNQNNQQIPQQNIPNAIPLNNLNNIQPPIAIPVFANPLPNNLNNQPQQQPHQSNRPPVPCPNFPIQPAENESRYERFFGEVNRSLVACEQMLNSNHALIPLPTLNTAQNILTSMSRTIRQYVHVNQAYLVYMMRLADYLEREELINRLEDRQEVDYLVGQCASATTELSKASSNLGKILKSTHMGNSPKGGFVSMAGTGVAVTSVAIPISVGNNEGNAQPVTTNLSQNYRDNLNQQNINNSANVDNINIPLEEPSAQNINVNPNVNEESKKEEKKEETPKVEEKKEEKKEERKTQSQQVPPHNNQRANNPQNNPFGNIMNQLLRPENFGNIMGMVNGIMNPNNPQSGAAMNNSFNNLMGNIMNNLNMGDDDYDDSSPANSNGEEERKFNQLRSDLQPTKTEEKKEETQPIQPSSEIKNESKADFTKVIQELNKIFSVPKKMKETKLEDLKEFLKLEPQKEFESFTNSVISQLTFYDLQNIKKMNLKYFVLNRKDILKLIEGESKEKIILRLTEIFSEKFILYENELDKLDSHQSFDPEAFYKNFFTQLIELLMDEKLNDYDFEDKLEKLILKSICTLKEDLSKAYKTGKEGAEYCLDLNLNSILKDMLGNTFLKGVDAFSKDFVSSMLSNYLFLAENYEMKMKLGKCNEEEDKKPEEPGQVRLLTTDEIFKIANEDKKRLDAQEKKDEKFSELYYRTSLFQE